MFFDNFAAMPLARPARAARCPSARECHAVSGPTAARACGSIARGTAPLLDRMLYADMKTYLVELLMKQDQMSMAASIESRVPFLDHKLVEFAATLPTSGSSPA